MSLLDRFDHIADVLWIRFPALHTVDFTLFRHITRAILYKHIILRRRDA